MISAHSGTRQLADALTGAALEAGANSPRVRGADWRLAEVTTVNADGTVIADGITVRRLESYALPAVGDVIVIAQSSAGNWVAEGRLATDPGGWTALTLASGYINPGHGYTASYLRAGRRIWMRGRIGRTGGVTIPNNTTIFTVPVAIRPIDDLDNGFAVVRDATTYPATLRVDITVTGIVRTYESDSLPTWISLDGITYTI